MELQFSKQFFEKCTNVKFRENPSRGGRVIPCGQTDGLTDRHEEANSRISQLCDGA